MERVIGQVAVAVEALAPKPKASEPKSVKDIIEQILEAFERKDYFS